MIEWLFNHIPTWWWVVLVIWTIAFRAIGIFISAALYILLSITLLGLYGLWCVSFGLFFPSIWDMPWWLWVLLVFSAVPFAGAGVAQATTIIHHRSDERVSDVTITRK